MIIAQYKKTIVTLLTKHEQFIYYNFPDNTDIETIKNFTPIVESYYPAKVERLEYISHVHIDDNVISPDFDVYNMNNLQDAFIHIQLLNAKNNIKYNV